MDEALEKFYKQYIGFKIRKKTNTANSTSNPFKSTFKINTVKNVIQHPKLNIPAFIFDEDDSYVACHGCRIYPETKLNFTKIQTLYPNSKVIAVESFTRKGLAWTKLETPAGISLEEQLLHCMFLGAEAVNLKVSQNGQFVYPDYMISELVTKSELVS